jgi:hypothetical protein
MEDLETRNDETTNEPDGNTTAAPIPVTEPEPLVAIAEAASVEQQDELDEEEQDAGGEA